jgi:hypothetical protein
LDYDNPEVADNLGFPIYLWVEDGGPVPVIELKALGDTPGQLSWSAESGLDQTHTLVDALVNLFGPVSALEALRLLLTQDGLDSEALSEGLESLLDLPALMAPEPDRGFVATRAAPAMVRLAAAIAGPTWILPVDAGWTVLIPTPDSDSPTEVLAAAVSAATKRGDRTLLLWAHDQSFGLQIWRRGSLDLNWSWQDDWENVTGDPLALETAVTDAVADLNPDLHKPSLRALLRQRRLDDEAVDSLLELLCLPKTSGQVLRAHTAAEDMPGSELVQQATPREATMAAMRADWATGGQIRHRRLYLAYAVGTVLAACLCLAMTCLGIAILVTDGAAIDQARATPEDRIFVGVFAGLTLILIPTALFRLRRSRRSREAD